MTTTSQNTPLSVSTVIVGHPTVVAARDAGGSKQRQRDPTTTLGGGAPQTTVATAEGGGGAVVGRWRNTVVRGGWSEDGGVGGESCAEAEDGGGAVVGGSLCDSRGGVQLPSPENEPPWPPSLRTPPPENSNSSLWLKSCYQCFSLLLNSNSSLWLKSCY
ncbi:hypothetical protein Hanom_Chr16g01447411 [Helianthus anomalus]